MKRFLTLLISLLTLSTTLSAREIISINDNWRFYFSKENSADYARTISLPHTWNFDQSSMLLSSQPSTANYIRDIYTPLEWSQNRIFIKFYGVHSVADIMVNGRYVGEHRGGATAFCFEITKFVNFGETNRVHVIVSDAPQTDILPTSHEDDYSGGIYRDVELIVTDKTVVSPLYYGSDGILIKQESISSNAAEGTALIHLNSTQSSNCALTLSIFDKENRKVFTKSVAKAKIDDDEPVTIPFTVDEPKLWSVDEPNLYRFVVDVKDGKNFDSVEVTSGFRSIDYNQTGAIRINGIPTPMRTVTLYHDYPYVGGAASQRDINRDFELVDELGANAIRSATRPHHQYLYDLCDQEGKLVWVDFPFVRAPFLGDIAYYPTERFHEQGQESITEIIVQNYNHPSVVMWGLFSLLTPRGDNPISYLQELNKLTKELDPSRPTVAVSDQDGAINMITDLIVWNQNLGWERGLFSDINIWSNMLHTKWSNMRSAVFYGQNGRIDQQADPADYKRANILSATSWKPEGRARKFHEEYAERLLPDTLFWGICLNSMFDFKSVRNALGENNSGLVTFDRRDRKDIFYLYKSHWQRNEPTLHIADSRNTTTQEPLHSLTVYASDTIAPILFTSTDTIEMRRIAPWQFQADSILLFDGTNHFTVQQGELTDSTTVTLQSPTSNYRNSRQARSSNFFRAIGEEITHPNTK